MRYNMFQLPPRIAWWLDRSRKI